MRTDIAGNRCMTSLLKDIPASAFIASSYKKSSEDFKPQEAKLISMHENQGNDRAWCPDQAVSTSSSQWIQISFNSMKMITNLYTRGRNDGNFGEFVSRFFFEYQREDNGAWFRYRDGDQKELIEGNHDTRNVALLKLFSPIVAQKIRIIPISNSSKNVCLKIGFYGCDFRDGVVEYRIPRGDVLSQGQNHISFDDDRYDDRRSSNKSWLLGGMGKLMDNLVPQSFSADLTDLQRFFVTWNQTVQKLDHVECWFRFLTVRKMKSVSFYPAVAPSLQLLPFSSVLVELSLSDLDFKVESNVTHHQDAQSQNNGPIKIKLENKLAKLIRVLIFFRSRCMGLSEVLFESEPVTLAPNPLNPPKPPDETVTTFIPRDYPSVVPSKIIINVTLIACIIGVSTFFMVFMVVGVIWARQRKRRRHKSNLCDYRSMLMNDQSYHSNIGNITTICGKNPMVYGPVFNPNEIGLRYVHPPYSHCREYRSHSSQNSNDYDHIESYWPKPPQQNAMDQIDRQTLHIVGTADTTINNSLNNLSGSVTIYSSTYSSPAYESNLPVPDIIPSTVVSQDTFSEIVNIHAVRPLKGLMGSSISPCDSTPVSVSWIDTAFSRLTEISPANIILQKHISQGQVASLRGGLVEDCNAGVIVAEIKNHQISVDMKYVFYRHCLATIKEDFTSHPNLMSVIGWCKQDLTDVSIVYAYPLQINLVSFFRNLRQTPPANDITFSCNHVSQAGLVFLMKQLAAALAFLDEISVIHRDVAARNCSIGDGLHLTLSDFAIGLEGFRDDYYTFSPSEKHSSNIEPWVSTAVSLPLLWMPWEAILTGNFSSKSDVWSFGVTLWETFTECQLKPYSIALPICKDDPGIVLGNVVLQRGGHPASVLPNGRTIDQSVLIHDVGGLTDISRQVRDIMHACWQTDPSLRPTFYTLCSFLSELSPNSRPVDEHGPLQRFVS